MCSDWNSQCKQFTEQYKCLNNLAITSPEGTVYGTSNPEFVVTPDMVTTINGILQGSADTSLNCQGSKFIKLQSDSNFLICRCAKRSLICYATPKLRLIGETVDTTENNCAPGNVAMNAISSFYSSSGF